MAFEMFHQMWDTRKLFEMTGAHATFYCHDDYDGTYHDKVERVGELALR